MKNLVERIKADDLTAVEELYQQVKPAGMKIAATYVGKEGLEEDMFHEAFIKALNNLDKFDMERPFQSWFDVILANTCKSYLRKRNSEKVQDIATEDEQEELLEGISDIGNPEDCWEQKELSEIMKGMLEGLSKEQKEAVILFYYQRLPIAQIAEIQNCGEDTVKSRLYQSRTKLKGAVEDYEKKQNIKLHSIGIVIALYVFFKSDMGEAFACENGAGAASTSGEGTAKAAEEMTKKAAEEAAKVVAAEAVSEAAKNVAEQAVAETAKAAAGETAKNVVGQTAAETAKAVASEAGKTAAMGLGTKAAIGAGIVLLAGLVGIGAMVMNKDDATDSMATNTSSTELAQASTEGEEIVPTAEPTAAPTAEPTIEPTEEPEETITTNLAAGITVHPTENGVKRISADMDVVTFSTINGGVIITYSETDGCGAIDYNGNVLVPNSYPYYYDIPDSQGNFVLGDGSTLDVFDKNGNLVHTITNWQGWNSIRVSEGYVTYATYDIDTSTATFSCYDIANDVLTSHSVQDYMVFVRACDVINGKYLCSYGESTDLVDNGIFYASVDGSITPIKDNGLYCIRVYGNPFEGYTFADWTEMEGAHYLFSEDFTEVIPIGIGNDFAVNNFVSEGNQYYNKGTKLVFTTTGLHEAWEAKYYLADFANYNDEEAYKIRECILAEYDYIKLSACGICYAEDETGNFFLNEDGTRIVDAYVDHSAFTDKYAAVLDSNGLAYLIDSDMNVLTQGYEAEVVYLRDQWPCYEGNNTQTLFIVE